MPEKIPTTNTSSSLPQDQQQNLKGDMQEEQPFGEQHKRSKNCADCRALVTTSQCCLGVTTKPNKPQGERDNNKPMLFQASKAQPPLVPLCIQLRRQAHDVTTSQCQRR
ncbi:hypothetical protein CHS0354_014333 [Potamilus streckersoni]|uniref:Uncharacterized protein n=1 Tax=Potamilus streckersoni TaxID=2493646 RepID=A0AAE0VYD5_9BIVA|nr:hypothetical protein CHS0354_014333 [Potamilus streckersoni]